MSQVKSACVGVGTNAAMAFDADQYEDAKRQILATSDYARWLGIFEIAVKHVEAWENLSSASLKGWMEVKILARRRLLNL